MDLEKSLKKIFNNISDIICFNKINSQHYNLENANKLIKENEIQTKHRINSQIIEINIINLNSSKKDSGILNFINNERTIFNIPLDNNENIKNILDNLLNIAKNNTEFIFHIILSGFKKIENDYSIYVEDFIKNDIIFSSI